VVSTFLLHFKYRIALYNDVVQLESIGAKETNPVYVDEGKLKEILVKKEEKDEHQKNVAVSKNCSNIFLSIIIVNTWKFLLL